MKDIISLVIHEAKKRPGADLSEEIFLVWMEVAPILQAIEVQIETINDSQMPDREKRQAIELILNAHKT